MVISGPKQLKTSVCSFSTSIAPLEDTKSPYFIVTDEGTYMTHGGFL